MFSLQKAWKEFLRLESKKKVMYSSLFLFLFIVGMYIGSRVQDSRVQDKVNQDKVNIVKKNQQSSSTKGINKNAELVLYTSTNSFSVGKAFEVGVYLEKQEAQAVDVALNYDPKKVQIQEVKRGRDFPNLITQKIDRENGRLLVSASIAPKKNAKAQKGQVFSFIVLPLEKGNVVFEFDSFRTVVGYKGRNILKIARGGIYKVE